MLCILCLALTYFFLTIKRKHNYTMLNYYSTHFADKRWKVKERGFSKPTKEAAGLSLKLNPRFSSPHVLPPNYTSVSTALQNSHPSSSWQVNKYFSFFKISSASVNSLTNHSGHVWIHANHLTFQKWGCLCKDYCGHSKLWCDKDCNFWTVCSRMQQLEDWWDSLQTDATTRKNYITKARPKFSIGLVFLF